MPEPIVLLMADNRGVYIPQNFAEEIMVPAMADCPETPLDQWKGFCQDQVDILLEGPEREDYWEVWDEVLNLSVFTDNNCNKYHLHQDGDLWAYCPLLMTCQEKRDFFYLDDEDFEACLEENPQEKGED